MQLLNLFLYAALTSVALAHPGADIKAEIEQRAKHLANPQRRTLSDCKRQLHESGYYKHRLAKRLDRANALRQSLGNSPIHAREIDPVLGVEDTLMPRDVLEEPQRAQCVADPEVTEGPYWVAGEQIRSNLLENMEGVHLHLDINVIDVTSCTPIPNIFVELWGCNSTGIYTGVVSAQNGAGLSAPNEINTTALRGIQPTSFNGTASFLTIVPGHYTGRTNHLHTIIHHNATHLPNNTIAGGTISHIGQLYFSESLLQVIESLHPYNTNTQNTTSHADDQFFAFGQQGGDNPIIQISQLGNEVQEGLYGFIDVGVNPAAVQNPQPAVFWGEEGGVPSQSPKWTGFPWTAEIRRLLTAWGIPGFA